MKFTELFTKTKKDIQIKDSRSANYLIRAGYIDQLASGFYTFLPLGLRVYKKIEQIIREEMDGAKGQEIFMPAMHPKSNWEKTGRLNEFDVLYLTKGSLTKDENVLGPTHEEVVTPLAAKFIFSYKDLPKYVYQIQNKFRDEARPKSGLLRAKEFMMKDLYSFHADEKDLEKYYELMKEVYFRVFERCGIGEKTVLTYASGGLFSEYSHEFQAICPTGEDSILLCEECNTGLNIEISEKHKLCPECSSKKLIPKKAIEVGNIFKLMDKFSKPFNLYYLDSKNQKKPVIMGCYGIGLGRLMASVVEVCGDEDGIIWPKPISPFDVHLVNLGKTELEAEDVYKKLKSKGIDVIWDNRDESAGVKLADSDLLGIPTRIVVSSRGIKDAKIEVKDRASGNLENIALDEFLKRS